MLPKEQTQDPDLGPHLLAEQFPWPEATLLSRLHHQ